MKERNFLKRPSTSAKQSPEKKLYKKHLKDFEKNSNKNNPPHRCPTTVSHGFFIHPSKNRNSSILLYSTFSFFLYKSTYRGES